MYEIGTEYFHRDIAEDVDTKFDTSGYLKDNNRLLGIRKKKKSIHIMKDELGGKIMTV